jgi:hypothetical protein
LTLASSCKKDAPRSERAAISSAQPGARPDPFADGKRLDTELAAWREKLLEIAPLPSCTDVLSQTSERALCTAAAAEIESLKAEVTRNAPHAQLMRRAAEAALATERACEKLRFASLSAIGQPNVLRERGAAASASTSRNDVVAPSASVLRKPGSHGQLAAKLGEHPSYIVLEAYRKPSKLALRYLGIFLQSAPLATRRLAAEECVRLAEVRPGWPAFTNLVAESALLETDPSLKASLQALATRLRPAHAPKQPNPRAPED